MTPGQMMAKVIGSLLGACKEALFNLGLSNAQVIEVLIIDAAGGAVATGISRSDFLAKAGEEYDAQLENLKKMEGE